MTHSCFYHERLDYRYDLLTTLNHRDCIGNFQMVQKRQAFRPAQKSDLISPILAFLNWLAVWLQIIIL